ncbi:hypothetical protein GQ55_6G160700 [Panicum hallii var. hallii]|uniref:Uncharacterized protein n=1 Tax=Panicum hallii var. hallii TaxID=1504633 RepID=A0A2T7D6J2_9POAL|nr:hypothetical protein GQ55_6G160700 [Panicum hallii var. hallii]
MYPHPFLGLPAHLQSPTHFATPFFNLSSKCGILHVMRPVVLSTSFEKMLLPFAFAGHRQLC